MITLYRHLYNIQYYYRRFDREEYRNKETSTANIIVCTPGRLLDHIQFTKDFTLEHLRFLVLDEADRLLGNAYHGWVRLLVQSASSAMTSSIKSFRKKEENNEANKRQKIEKNGQKYLPVNEQANDSLESCITFPKHYLQRLLFSATLTDNPSKLALLNIYNPLLIRSNASLIEKSDSKENSGGSETPYLADNTNSASFTLPTSLLESRISCTTEEKPQILLAMLHEMIMEDTKETVHLSKSHRGVCSNQENMIIIFCSSVETTHRLCRLLQLVNGQLVENHSDTSSVQKLALKGKIVEMSRLMSNETRKETMKAAREGQIKIFVCYIVSKASYDIRIRTTYYNSLS